MKAPKSFRLIAPINSRFFILLAISVVLISIYAISNQTVSIFQIAFVSTTILFILFNQNNNNALISNEQLLVSSVTTYVVASWAIKRLDISSILLLSPKTDPLPEMLKPGFLSLNSRVHYGHGELKSGQPVFQFVSRTNVPLVLIPVKSGGHILLALEKPEEFIAALKEAHANS